VIWAHAGWSNTGVATPQLMRALLTRNPNLYSSIKLRGSANRAQEKVRIVEGGVLVPAWKALLEDYSDRFVIGTDVKLGDDEDYEVARGYGDLLAQLPHAVARRIAIDNATLLLNLQR
jgi:hypothetical protein